jgi:hypothetical protein
MMEIQADNTSRGLIYAGKVVLLDPPVAFARNASDALAAEGAQVLPLLRRVHAAQEHKSPVGPP